MMPTYDEQVIEFLATRENFKHALEVARVMPEVRARLERKFWESLKKELAKRLTGVAGWEVHADDSREIWIRPAVGQQQSASYSVVMEKDSQRLFYGICCSVKQQRSLAELSMLLEQLRGSKPKKSGLDNEWWLAWWWTDTSIDDALLLRMTEEPDRLIADHVELLWDLFAKHRDALETINRKLAAQAPAA